jgi:hypothetical protein
MDQLLCSQPLEDSLPEHEPSRIAATTLARLPQGALATALPTREAVILLSPNELYELTHYRLAAKQLEELRRQGFYRARIGRSGAVVLERAHYEAVCRGVECGATAARPKVRPYRSRQHEKGRSSPA